MKEQVVIYMIKGSDYILNRFLEDGFMVKMMSSGADNQVGPFCYILLERDKPKPDVDNQDVINNLCLDSEGK